MIPPLPPGLEPDQPDPDYEPPSDAGPLKPLDPWPGESPDLHAEFLRFAAWWADGKDTPRKGSGVLSAILVEARTQGVIRPGILDADAVAWSWLARARAYRRELADDFVAKSRDQAAAIHEGMVETAAELLEILRRTLVAARATGRVPKDEIASLEKLAKTAALLSGRPTARVGLDLSGVPSEELRASLAILDKAMNGK